ncbi:MAG: hypothetical protein DRQ64_00270 [Gammaproteobacteria bacterium]|nr:MAG: hypothetical protein DRQ64_00270 [Gammaproteobacteria bacterium]
MDTKPLNTALIADLHTWVNSPTTLRALDAILDQLNYNELFFCTLLEDKDVARIAWAEVGVRRGILNLHRKAVEIDGTLQLSYEGKAFPMAKRPRYQKVS